MNQNLGVSIKNLTTQFEHAYLVDQPLQKEEKGEGGDRKVDHKPKSRSGLRLPPKEVA